MKTAVVTLCIGEEWERIADLTHPTIKSYSNKIKSDFILINYPQINAKDIGFEKCQLYNILDYYDRVIYLDTDIIVTERCPNLFEVVPENDLGAFIESNYWQYSNEVNHFERIKNIQERLGNIKWTKDYFNTGVMVLSKKHKNMFKLDKKYIVDLREQTQLNYHSKLLGFWIHDIGIRFNKMDFINPSERFESYIIHYAGKGYTSIFHNIIMKTARIIDDLEILKSF